MYNNWNIIWIFFIITHQYVSYVLGIQDDYAFSIYFKQEIWAKAHEMCESL